MRLCPRFARVDSRSRENDGDIKSPSRMRRLCRPAFKLTAHLRLFRRKRRRWYVGFPPLRGENDNERAGMTVSFYSSQGMSAAVSFCFASSLAAVMVLLLLPVNTIVQ